MPKTATNKSTSGAPKTAKSKETDFLKMELDEQVRLVNGALEEDVYYALEMDGGGMEIMDIDGLSVLIRYHGACGNCHISQTGTLAFIQQTLKEKVDPRIQVVVV